MLIEFDFFKTGQSFSIIFKTHVKLQGTRGPQGVKGEPGQKGMPGTCNGKVSNEGRMIIEFD